jgi:hypothetical protein
MLNVHLGPFLEEECRVPRVPFSSKLRGLVHVKVIFTVIFLHVCSTSFRPCRSSSYPKHQNLPYTIPKDAISR